MKHPQAMATLAAANVSEQDADATLRKAFSTGFARAGVVAVEYSDPTGYQVYPC